MFKYRLASRNRLRNARLASVLMLLAMVLASVTVGVSAQGLRDVNNPTQGVQPQAAQPQAAQPERITRPDNAKPGIYHIDYLNDFYNFDPNKYPIDGSIGFWTWSKLNPGEGKYDWTPPASPPAGWLGTLDTWIKSRVDRSTTPTGVGIMISTYDATTASDILSTPNWVIKKADTVIPATTSPGSKVPNAEHYIDYYYRRSKSAMNSEFESGLTRWVASDSSAVVVDAAPPADSHTTSSDTLPDRPAKGQAIKLGGADNVNATLAKDTQDLMSIPAMPPELNGKQNIYVQARVHIETTDPNPNDHLYFELWDDTTGNKLGGTQVDVNNLRHAGQGATYWEQIRFDVTSFASREEGPGRVPGGHRRREPDDLLGRQRAAARPPPDPEVLEHSVQGRLQVVHHRSGRPLQGHAAGGSKVQPPVRGDGHRHVRREPADPGRERLGIRLDLRSRDQGHRGQGHGHHRRVAGMGQRDDRCLPGRL